MAVGSGSGTQPEVDSTSPLTADSAAEVFEGLLSEEEDTERPKKTPAKKEPEPEGEDVPEATDEGPVEGDDVEEPAEPDEETETTETEPRKLKVKLPEGEQELPEDEVVKGYLRTADYTRKTQEVAEKRKAVEAKEREILGQAERYVAGLTQLEIALKEAVPQEPDWEDLAKDPETFTATRKAWDQYQKQLNDIRAEKERAIEDARRRQAEAFKTHLDSERSLLLEKLPSWGDEATAKKEKGELTEFAKSIGFTDDDVSRVYDHRLIVLLHKAMLHDRAEKAKPKVREKIESVRTPTPGPKSDNVPKKVTEVTRGKQRLAKTGAVSDAASLLELMIDD